MLVTERVMAESPTSPVPQPRWKTIVDALRAEIPNHRYGGRFYSIAEICERYEVSAITARRVLTEMQTEGLVEKIRSRGTVVRRLSSAVSVRLVMPSGARPDYQTTSVVMRRQLAGITEFAKAKQIDFDTISEAHLAIVFARGHDAYGFLVAPGVSHETLDFLSGRGLPFVLLNPISGWKGRCHARPDRVQAGYVAAEFLMGLGHRRIGYILGSISQRNFRDRLIGYRAAHKDSKLRFDWELVRETDGQRPEQDEEALAALLSLRSPPTAVMTGDDGRAIQVLECCRRQGIEVPRQLSILGYPNYPEAMLTDPPLSVVDACYEDVGAAAMRLLMDQMYDATGRGRVSMVIPPKLIARGSTGPGPARAKIDL
jgi:DNA-binding LacI/PurR family transcriptional regulator